MRLKPCVALLIVLFVLLPFCTYAAEITVTPSIGLRGEYDDNILFDRTGEIDDYAWITIPGLSLDYITSRFSFSLSGLADIIRYVDETDLDTENYTTGLTAEYRTSEYLTLSARGSYIKDTTLDSELQETGLVLGRSDREAYTAGGGIVYSINEFSDITLDYTFTNVDYDLEEYVDYKEHSVSATNSYTFNDRRNEFRIRPYYRYRDSTDDDVDIYGLSLGLTHRFTETFEASIDAGARYLDIEEVSGTTESDWGWTADVSLTKSWQAASVEFLYSKDLGYTAEGSTVDVNRFSLTISRMLTSKLGIDLTGTLYFTKERGMTDRDDNVRYYEVIPLLNYGFTQNHSLELGYRYSNEYDKNFTNYRERDRNIAWIALNFSFPQKW